MSPTSSEQSENAVLILAPTGRDGPASADLLRRAGLSAHLCADAAELVARLQQGAGAVLIAEEALRGAAADALTEWVGRQPPWSDMPFVMLTSHREHPAVIAARRRLVAALRNVSLLERPLQTITLTSAVQSSLRARRRQYEVRAHLAERNRAARKLENLVAARTRELEAANCELRAQMAERARIEEALRHAQKLEAIGQLTGGIAHDFNNLLMVITGGLETLEGRIEPERRRRLLESMRQAAARGASLTRQLLTFSRLQALSPEPLDLHGQFAGIRELLDRSLRGDVTVVLDLAEDLWPVLADPGELELAVLNLAVNARDAMPAGGTITIRAVNREPVADGELRGGFVSLSVIDTGTGIPPEVLSRVFDPFFTTKEVGQGSGMGLAQVYGFAKQSGGAVRIESEVGRGTTITLLLPRSVTAPAPPQPAEAAGAQRSQEASAEVLLVEDDNEVAALVTEMLAQLGMNATRAASAEAALGALANGRRIDLVFSDVMMPGGMNGVALAREVRRRRPDLPILLTTAYAEATRREAEAEGIALLPKPYRLEDLAAATSNALGR
ncbi:MAG TPA: ATP-binding protein [Acetobacteraceae bacterium]|nr:ATP-binding protein [Acetobacteraceae bacterium]